MWTGERHLFIIDTPCIFNAPAYNKSNEKSLERV
ncbi:hypothetical protein Q604_UNBc4C00151G0002, partial [human gut metagenome]